MTTSPRSLRLKSIRARRDAIRDMLRAGVIEQRRKPGLGRAAIRAVARQLDAGRAV